MAGRWGDWARRPFSARWLPQRKEVWSPRINNSGLSKKKQSETSAGHVVHQLLDPLPGLRAMYAHAQASREGI